MAKNFNQFRAKLGLDDQLGFGQYAQYTVLEVIKDKPSYIQWLIDNAKTKFYPSVFEELAKHNKHTQRAYNRKYHNVHSDQDDWWEDVPF